MRDREPLTDDDRRSFGAGGGFITAFLTATQESRARRAAQELRCHRHIVGEAETDAINRARSAARPDGGRTAARRGANILIPFVLIGFAVLHFIGGTVIHAAAHAVATSHHTLAAD